MSKSKFQWTDTCSSGFHPLNDRSHWNAWCYKGMVGVIQKQIKCSRFAGCVESGEAIEHFLDDLGFRQTWQKFISVFPESVCDAFQFPCI
jgi:hypothetical protein